MLPPRWWSRGALPLDTGQGTAKHITRDNFEPGPPDLAKVSFVSAVNSSRACGRGLRGACGNLALFVGMLVPASGEL